MNAPPIQFARPRKARQRAEVVASTRRRASGSSTRLACAFCLLLVAGYAAAQQQPGATFNPTINPTADRGAREPTGEQRALRRLQIDLRSGALNERVARVMAEMTVDEKVGQLCQVAVFSPDLPDEIVADLRAGRIGSLFYTGSAEQIRKAQRIAQQESRLGLPLLVPRDVIHGFRTVFPIPLGQAASWDPELVERAATVAAAEAKREGVNWTFAPMLDITRDARWGRIAESVGEDPVLASALGRAMVRGFQGEVTGDRVTGVAACAKHYAGYGLTEGGRDYNRAQVATSELHNVFLAPFRAAVDEGCLTLMTGFSSVNGVPGTGHEELLRGVLKQRWGFRGLVVSDWGAVVEMIAHGYAADNAHAAELAIEAGVDMEMATDTYRQYLRDLVEAGRIDQAVIDDAVARVLRVKLQAALPSENNDGTHYDSPSPPSPASLEVAKKLAVESVVLLKNDDVLPLRRETLKRVAVIGPLAEAGRDQLGCWTLDGKPEETVTVADALREALEGAAQVEAVAGLESPLDESDDRFAAAEAARAADVAVLCVGEGWQLSGEARCRVNLGLPGAQRELVRAVAATGTPTVLVVMAGRPLTIGDEIEAAGATLYAWHPGTMGGAAIADLLLGVESPSGKLPVTFPKHVGQVPLYYNHPSTGRPPLAATRAPLVADLSDFPEEQKYRSHYLDVDPFPLFPFGYGLSYTTFEYGEPELTGASIAPGETLAVRVRVSNTGRRAGDEVVQLYVQDVTASLVRPVRELKAFRRVRLEAGESTVVEFALSSDQLAYYDNDAQLVLEPGRFRLGVGGDSTAPLTREFALRDSPVASGGAAADPGSARAPR